MSLSLVERCGGSITVDSAAGRAHAIYRLDAFRPLALDHCKQ